MCDASGRPYSCEDDPGAVLEVMLELDRWRHQPGFSAKEIAALTEYERTAPVIALYHRSE